MLRVHCKLAAARVQLSTLHTVSPLRWSEKTESLMGWQKGPSIVEPGSGTRIPLAAELLRTLFDV
jgi:hypothetical protein